MDGSTHIVTQALRIVPAPGWGEQHVLFRADFLSLNSDLRERSGSVVECLTRDRMAAA